MSVSLTMEVVTTTAMTQMEITHVPAMMTTSLTVMNTPVKVPWLEHVIISNTLSPSNSQITETACKYAL